MHINLPDHARLGLKLYFWSPSLYVMLTADMSVSPHNGVVELDLDKLAASQELCVDLFNATMNVADFRPATKDEVGEYLEREREDEDDA